MRAKKTHKSGTRLNYKEKNKFEFLPYQFLLPSMILIGLINMYPMFSGFYYSTLDGNLIDTGSYAGVDNFVKLASMPDFWSSLQFSAIFALFSVLGSYFLGLAFALLLNQEVTGRAFFRVALLVPWVVPGIVAIVSWRWLISDHRALVNLMLDKVGIDPILFLSDSFWAVVSVIVVKIWRSFPFMMISMLAALQTIDRSLYEAAYIDGAGSVKSFFYVTLPQIKGISIVCWILMTIWSFNDFETIWLLTGGGPAKATESLIILGYIYTFGRNQIGIGAAIAIVSLIILMALAMLLLKKEKND